MRSAVLLAALGIGLLAAMDAGIKLMGDRYPVFEVAFFRYAAGSLVASAVLAWTRPGWPGRETVVANATRSVLVVITATSFFYSLTALPLAEAVALSFVAPLMIALLGVVLLDEHFSTRIAITLAIGFAGMLVVVGGRLGGGPASGWGIAAALLSAFTYALSLVLLRARARRDPVPTIVWFQNVGPLLILIVPTLWVWRMPDAADLAVFLAIGLAGVGGHILMAHAFAHAEAAVLAPMEYTALVWGSLWGFLFFAEVPAPATIAGAAMIVAGTLWGQWRRGPAPEPARAAGPS